MAGAPSDLSSMDTKLSVNFFFLALGIEMWCLSRVHADTWRYDMRVEEDVFTTRDQITLTNLDDAANTILWTVDGSACDLVNSSSAVSKMRCSYPGIYEVSLSLDGSNSGSGYFFVEKNSRCFQWTMARNDSGTQQYSVASNAVEHVFVWVIDGKYANEEELRGTAAQPSKYSTVLTRQLQILGQKPRLRVFLRENEVHVKGIQYHGFSSNDGAWHFSLPILPYHQPHIYIQGQPVALYDCFVRDIHVLLPQTVMTLPSGNNISTIAENLAHGKPQVFKDPCMKNVAAFLSRGEVYLTQDNFITTEKLNLPGNYTVLDIAFTFSHFAVLTDVGLLIWDKSHFTSVQYTGLPGSYSQIRGRDWCLEGTLLTTDNDTLAVWNSSKVFLSGVSRTFSEVDLPTSILGPGSEVTIHDVSFSPFPNIVFLLMTVTNSSDSEVILGQYQYSAGGWGIFWTGINNGGLVPYSVLFHRSGRNSVYMWNAEKLFLYRSSENYFGTMTVQGTGTSTLVVSGESIQQVGLSSLGEAVILTTDNNLYYSQVSLQEVIQIHLGELSLTDASLWFNGLGQLYILSHIGSTVTRRHFPLYNEVLSALYPDIICPYYQLGWSLEKDIHYLDIGESLQFSAWVIHSCNSSNQLQVLMQGELLNVSSSTISIAGSSMAADNMSLLLAQADRFSYPQYYQTERTSYTGVVGIEFRPTELHMACRAPHQLVAYISVGCPVGRHIRVARPASCASLTNYTIEKETYTTEAGIATIDKTVVYNYAELGCPINHDVMDNFIPQVFLYDGDQLLEEVTADYVLHEDQQRTGIMYNTTMQQVGCVLEAQGWDTMLANAQTGLSLDQVWGPQNYVSCFVQNNTSVTGSGWQGNSYEILNSSSTAAIEFPKEYNGIYVFTLQVVDPNYSFCQLKTRFAVQTMNAIGKKDLTALGVSLLVFIISLFIGLIGTYIHFRKLVIDMINASEDQTIS